VKVSGRSWRFSFGLALDFPRRKAKESRDKRGGDGKPFRYEHSTDLWITLERFLKRSAFNNKTTKKFSSRWDQLFISSDVQFPGIPHSHLEVAFTFGGNHGNFPMWLSLTFYHFLPRQPLIISNIQTYINNNFFINLNLSAEVYIIADGFVDEAHS
jgi:hypothetical protein